jgi:hypothetical protein
MAAVGRDRPGRRRPRLPGMHPPAAHVGRFWWMGMLTAVVLAQSSPGSAGSPRASPPTGPVGVHAAAGQSSAASAHSDAMGCPGSASTSRVRASLASPSARWTVGLECAAGVVDGQGAAADLGVADGLFAAGVAGRRRRAMPVRVASVSAARASWWSVSLPSRSSARRHRTAQRGLALVPRTAPLATARCTAPTSSRGVNGAVRMKACGTSTAGRARSAS